MRCKNCNDQEVGNIERHVLETHFHNTNLILGGVKQ